MNVGKPEEENAVERQGDSFLLLSSATALRPAQI